MDKKEIAKRINVTITTLYNWQKTKPELIKLIEYGLKYENGGEIGQSEIIKYFNEIKEKKKEKEKKNNLMESKLLELFEKLNEKEKKFYIADIEARILKKEIE
ncbi:TetR/AcrR family transcriptional regulator [Campylobacter sp. CNRCH_2016_3089]|uniref:TetR/AcrR family transcriptional regulator n=1 Tax=unclassified Campylobacter TaxID=2593542 RepID=UPI0021E6D398|nr:MULTISPECIES: TetR/AcrR family transcriptional regulator [unclassified Campylobacter]MCV3402631.1 TetR/AcrR family transcriptional regulator [Campylobacter sp. IFREMER_LSEM_CL2090]MCV3508130.1 TetR/AcrR family transcriptional regulator [Campylobacter sp. CNRCH_2016_3089]HEC1793308.1 TetR/AcrR family transcriptional regulator [Campylobacter lari]